MTLRPGAAENEVSAASSGPSSALQVSPGQVTTEQREAFARQFKASFRILWTIAAGIVNNAAAAEDVVQEAAVVALGKLHEFRPDSNFNAWMAQIVRFVALNSSRRRKRQPTNSDPNVMDDTYAAAGSVLAVSTAAVRGVPLVSKSGELDESQSPFDDKVMRALQSVSDVARACLLLRTIEGLNYDEISAALDIPPGTAMSHVHRTRLFLRERLTEMDPVRAQRSASERGSTHD